MMDAVRRFCIDKKVGYGMLPREVIRKIEAKLHSILDAMSTPYYVAFYADAERRARMIVQDMLDGTCLM